MKPRSHKNAILPRSSQDVMNLEEEVPDSPSSSDNDSVGSQVQAEVNANDYIPNLVHAKPQKTLLILEKEVQGWYDTITKENADFDPEDAVIAETAEPPPDLIVSLLKYQEEFLAWASKQEVSPARGGILADEMGMGKTLQAISLVLARREVDRATSRDAVGCTLVLCPPVALSQWLAEINRSTYPGKTKVLEYYGPKRDKNEKEFVNYDFVLTTYTTVEYDYREKNAGEDRRNSPLHTINWNRIILDEAHNIKNEHSQTARAVFALEATYRWALSGTPLQNRIGEIYSLIRFLRIFPYSYHFCMKCDCQVLDHSAAHINCPSCPHNRYQHHIWWRKFVAKPINKFGRKGLGKRAYILLKHKILKEILLRRTKLGRAADLALPPRIISLRRDALDTEEANYYESLYKDSKTILNTYIEAGTLMNNYANILSLLTRLRQAVNHPYLVEHSSSSNANANLLDENKNEQEYGLCHELTKDYFRKGNRASSILDRINLNGFKTSTKIEALREEIRFMVERDGSAKAIVFSQFTSFLDLISYALGKSGVSYGQLVGGMSRKARDAAIKKFKEDPDCRVILMSLQTGGVALNLTVASHVFMMDPWWNPAVERQAQDRIHRIGQYKPIRVVRFIMEKTIEERILTLQKKKENLFESTVGDFDEEALQNMSEGDIMSLFAEPNLVEEHDAFE